MQLTVYISPARVSVSPDSVGAGPVNFTVTNQATASESLAIAQAGAAGQSLANTGPINPQGTAQVSVTFSSPGDYTVSATGGATGEATASTSGSQIAGATIHIGPPRKRTNNQLLTP